MSFKYSAPQRTDHPDNLVQYGWVRKTYGKETRGTRWKHQDYTYYFRDERDLTLFLIRWPQ